MSASLTSVPIMSMLTSLPCEVVATILRNLDDFQSLVQALLSCRHIHLSFNEYRSNILRCILRHRVAPALLPYAMAVMEASRQRAPRTLASVKVLLDNFYNEPSQLTSQLDNLPADLVLKMGHTQDIIDSFVHDFATDAWSLVPRGNRGLPIGVLGSLSLSPTEYCRFCRNFYLLELLITLPRDAAGVNVHKIKHDDDFFSRLAPWEMAQLVCVHDFLEKRLLQGSVDVLMRDNFFVGCSIDYVTFGHGDYILQGCLAKGLEFINQVMKEVSYEEKKALLRTAFPSTQVHIHKSLASALNNVNRLGGTKFLLDYTEDEMEAITPKHALNIEDMDTGPRVV